MSECTLRTVLLAGVDPIVKKLHTYQYGVALESNQSCVQQVAQRANLTAEAANHNMTIAFGECASTPLLTAFAADGDG